MSIILKHKRVTCDCCYADITNERFYLIPYKHRTEFVPFLKMQICNECFLKMREYINMRQDQKKQEHGGEKL